MLYTSLLCLLVCKRCKGTSHIGKLPIVIAIFAITNGMAAVSRVHALFPVLDNQTSYTVF